MATEASAPAGGWPFWAPSTDDAVERALTLAGVGEADRFVDLGCGDGRVLVAAARRGAVVTGLECDAELAAEARRRLSDAGVVGGTVRQADILAEPLDADVAFTYLSPATLQRLRPALDRLHPGTRLVTVDFAVPGVAPDDVDGGAHLYVLPLRDLAPRRRPGWEAAGGLVVAVPDVESLTSLEVAHPGGPVVVTMDGDLAEVASFATGIDHSGPGQAVAIDVRWGGYEVDTVAAGRLRVTGVEPFPMFVLFSHEEGGLWDLDAGACERLERCFADGVVPASVDDLLAVAEGEA